MLVIGWEGNLVFFVEHALGKMVKLFGPCESGWGLWEAKGKGVHPVSESSLSGLFFL